MSTSFVDLDVRPILRAGGEPFGKIMAAVQSLTPGQGLRLFATFKPVPLFQVLASKGFSHEEKECGGGDWEILFRPAGARAKGSDNGAAAGAAPTAAEAAEWPAPLAHLDNRDLEPPEPMVRILKAIEGMKEGEVLSALLCREPMFLLPELAKRKHRWHGAFEPDGKTYKLLVLVGAGGKAAT